MVAPRWFVGFDSLMQLIGSIIALSIAYYALKGYRLTRERTLFYLHFSFVLLGVGLFTDGVVTLPATRLPGLLPLANITYYIRISTEIIGYGLLLYAYLRRTKQTLIESAPVTAIIGHSSILELIVFFILSYITIQCAMNYSVKKDRNVLLVLLGFLLLAVSHLLSMVPPLLPLLFVASHVAQLLGFICLLAMLVRVAEIT